MTFTVFESNWTLNIPLLKASHGHSFPIRNFLLAKMPWDSMPRVIPIVAALSVLALGFLETQLQGDPWSGQITTLLPRTKSSSPLKMDAFQSPESLGLQGKTPPFSGTGIAVVSFREGSENSFPLSVFLSVPLFANSFTITSIWGWRFASAGIGPYWTWDDDYTPVN